MDDSNIAVRMFFFTWLVLCAVAGYIANQKGRSAIGFFLLALGLSPIIGIICAFGAAPNKRVLAQRENHESPSSVGDIVQKVVDVPKGIGASGFFGAVGTGPIATVKWLFGRTKGTSAGDGYSEEGREKAGGSSDSAETRTCPFCAEDIKARAIVCRFCGRDVAPL